MGWVPPGPAHPERLALPLHLSGVAAAMFDDLPDSVAPSAVDDALHALRRGRDEMAARLPAETEILVDAYRVRLAAACPASAAPHRAEFQWAPATAARYLGLRALALHVAGDHSQIAQPAQAVKAAQPAQAAPRRRDGGALPVEQAVVAVMAGCMDAGGHRTPGPWLAQLGTAGQAVVQAHAQRWAQQAATWLPLRLIDPQSLHFLDDDWWPGRSNRDRTLVVHGRRDITVAIGNQRVAVTLAGGTARSPGAAEADAVSALAAILTDPHGRLARVVRVHPASGEVVAVDVTDTLLGHGVQVVLATMSAMASAIAGTAVPATTGPGCTWCDQRLECQPGTAWMNRPDRRVMGLPVPAGLV